MRAPLLEAPNAVRWTTGRALLPAALWTGSGATSREIELAAPALPRRMRQAEPSGGLRVGAA